MLENWKANKFLNLITISFVGILDLNVSAESGPRSENLVWIWHLAPFKWAARDSLLQTAVLQIPSIWKETPWKILFSVTSLQLWQHSRAKNMIAGLVYGGFCFGLDFCFIFHGPEYAMVCWEIQVDTSLPTALCGQCSEAPWESSTAKTPQM